jgi:hypothetical protein
MNVDLGGGNTFVVLAGAETSEPVKLLAVCATGDDSTDEGAETMPAGNTFIAEALRGFANGGTVTTAYGVAAGEFNAPLDEACEEMTVPTRLELAGFGLAAGPLIANGSTGPIMLDFFTENRSSAVSSGGTPNSVLSCGCGVVAPFDLSLLAP